MMCDPLVPDASRPVRLRAARVSQAIAPLLSGRRPTGRVTGVHRRALALRIGPSRLAVTTPSIGVLPFGLSLAGEMDLRSLGVEPDTSFVVTGSSLQFGPSLERGPAIVTAGALSWSPRIGIIASDPSDLWWRASVIRSAARGLADDSGFGPLLAGSAGRAADAAGTAVRLRAGSAVGALCRALDGVDVDGAVAAGAGLIGLGIGSTPSGDDLIVGLIAALHATRHSAAMRFGAGCAAIAAGRTTDLGEAFLRHAGRGEFGGRVHDLVRAVVESNPAALPGVVVEARAWGGTSGIDCLFGVVLGLEIAGRRARAAA